MPRTPPHTLIWSSEHSRYDLYTQGYLEAQFRPEDREAWLTWLETVTSFAFRGVCGNLSVYQEARRRVGRYWYAYATTSHRTRKRYLGQTARVTFASLEEAAKALGSESSSTPLAPERGPDEQDVASHQAWSAPSREVSQRTVMLSTKLSHPVLSSRLLARERLLHRLDAARFHRLTLLSASAGWGKTTLLATWASRSTLPIAWLSLDELDNDPARFWVSVLAALRTCLPGVGETALSMLCSPQPPSLTICLTTLLNDLCVQDEPTILLLDDYHLIDEQAIHDSLLFVLDHLPAHLHLVLASRVDPPLTLSRWRVRGQLLELRDADLRFEEEEAAQFLTHTMALSLEEQEVAELVRRTEGWIAGLQLAALSLVYHPDRAVFVQGFAGSHRYVLDYVQEEILARLPAPLRDFLLQTSILNRMSASLCQAVTAEPESQGVLETMERANLFLVPLDDERKWFRFHDLFREALLARLQITRPEGTIPLLHQRAARWYEEQGEFREAISHWLSAKDFSSAVRLMEQKVQQFWLQGEAATMYHWIMALPDALVCEHAAFVLTAALYLVTAASHTAAAQLTPALRQAEQLMARVEHAVFLGDRGVETDKLPETQRTRRRLHLLHLYIEMQRIELNGFQDRFYLVARQVQLLDQDDEIVWQMIPLAATFLLHYSYQLQGALVVSQFLEAKQRADLAGDRYAMIRIRQWLALSSQNTGQLYQMHQESLEGLALLEQNGGYGLLTGYFYLCLAVVYYHWNQLDEARLVLRQLIPIAATWQQLDLLVFGYLDLARVELAARDLEAARRALEEAENPSRMNGSSPTTTVPHIVALRAQWFLMRGKLTQASNLTAEVALIQDESVYFHFPEFFALIHAYLAQKRYSLAVETLERCSKYFDQLGNIFLTILFLSRYVAALHLARKQEQTRTVAIRLLTLTEPEGYIRVYLNEGEPMKQVLKTLLNTPQDDEENTPPIPRAYISTLLSAFEQEEQKFAAMEETPQSTISQERETQPPEGPGLADSLSKMPAPVEALTPQEQRVLRLLAAGRSNGEIASDLVVSINTVKAHVKKIYSKLHVGNRVAAIEVARALHLL